MPLVVALVLQPRRDDPDLPFLSLRRVQEDFR